MNSHNQWLTVLIASVFLVTFWMIVNLVGFYDWDKGLYRAGVSSLAGTLVAAFMVSQFSKSLTKLRLTLGITFSIAVGLMLWHTKIFEIFSFGQVSSRHPLGIVYSCGLLLFLAIIISSVTLWDSGFPMGRHLQSKATLSLIVISLCLGAFHFHKFYQSVEDPNTHNLSDIATTTVKATEALRNGKDPYSLQLDRGNREDAENLRYGGYKYLPMMILTFLPLSYRGDAGLITTNFVLDVVVFVTVFSIAKNISGQDTVGWAAGCLYLSVPFLPTELFELGVTDLAPVVYLLWSLLFLERSSWLSGLFIGLSSSAKLLPGLLLIPLWVPPKKRSSYWTGTLLGFFPSLLVFLKHPQSFITNIIAFNFVRSQDSTSWLYFAAPEMIPGVRTLALSILTLFAMYTWAKTPSLLVRCELAILSILLVLLSAPINHRNYQLWWIPLFAIVVGVMVSTYSQKVLLILDSDSVSRNKSL